MYTAQRTAVEGDDELLDEAEELYTQLAAPLGEIRVDVLDELADFGGQSYREVEVTPDRALFQSGSCSALDERDALESAAIHGMVTPGGIHFALSQEGDRSEWESGVDLTPEQCRRIALLLFRMAADAENSETVDTGESR